VRDHKEPFHARKKGQGNLSKKKVTNVFTFLDEAEKLNYSFLKNIFKKI
jgi:hypothetical protein